MEDQELDLLVRALAVAYNACKGGSLFASKAFIDCVLEAYTNGRSMNEIKV